MLFSLEKLSDCKNEIEEILVKEHWPEVGHYSDIPIDPEWSKYRLLEENNMLRCFVIRTPLNEEFKESMLIGYAIFMVDKHLHYRNTIVASQDMLFVKKSYRGIGHKFLEWCDEVLKEEGVTTVTHHAKPWFNYGKLFEKMGYEKAETIWARRLD